MEIGVCCCCKHTKNRPDNKPELSDEVRRIPTISINTKNKIDISARTVNFIQIQPQSNPDAGTRNPANSIQQRRESMIRERKRQGNNSQGLLMNKMRRHSGRNPPIDAGYSSEQRRFLTATQVIRQWRAGRLNLARLHLIARALD